ncbi:hypothetical protein T492DRAFT_887335 [Pavlovales sp. CCMP2436]|nr:hypothetical protein T492DRAFT_887335 [Pavlovales sp. CCMP2436]
MSQTGTAKPTRKADAAPGKRERVVAAEPARTVRTRAAGGRYGLLEHVLAKVTMSQRAAAALEQLLPPIVARHRMGTSPASDMLAIWSAAGGKLPAAELESSQFRTFLASYSPASLGNCATALWHWLVWARVPPRLHSTPARFGGLGSSVPH